MVKNGAAGGLIHPEDRLAESILVKRVVSGLFSLMLDKLLNSEGRPLGPRSTVERADRYPWSNNLFPMNVGNFG